MLRLTTHTRRLCLLALCLAFIVAGAEAKGRKTLTILHTNDTHSCVMPLSRNLPDTALAGRGGYLRRMVMIDDERKADPDLMLFDSGDFSQGSPYYTLFRGDVEGGLMNMMGYDAATIGNHEFDYGLDNMARLFRSLSFPIVCANYKFSECGLDTIVKPYVIIKRKGMKIGVFGLSPQLDGLVDKKNYRQTQYLDPIASARAAVAELKKQKCDLIILLSHLGWDEGTGIDDRKLIAATTGIDLVLGGHSHTYFETLRYADNADGKPVPVDQNGKSAIFVGKMTLTMSR